MKNYACVVLGDINIDYVSDLSEYSFRDIDNACINSIISSYVGGNGTFFAEAAMEAGFNSIKLISSLGKDVAAEIAKSYFDEKNIELVIIPIDGETGKVLILYQPDDKRILIADRGVNEKMFTSSCCKVTDFIHLPADLFYISGYSLLNKESDVTLNSIIEKYKSYGAFNIIDVVPHEIFQIYNWDDYVYQCRGIDGIVIELTTALGFMKQIQCKENIDDVADFLLTSFQFCLIRMNSESDFLIADKTNRRIARIHYQPRVASLRFTDRVIAQIVLRYINNPSEIFTSSDWIHEINEKIGKI